VTDDTRLDIEQDLRFQRREWRFQRAGLVVLSAFVLAALLGVFGNGALSGGHARGPGALAVTYERLTRAHRTSRIAIEMPAAAGAVELVVNREYFDAVRIERLDPEPSAIDIGRGEVVFHFPPPTSSARAYTAVLDVVLNRPGRHPVRLRAGGAALAFSQFAFF
jgi:hypothetical protein